MHLFCSVVWAQRPSLSTGEHAACLTLPHCTPACVVLFCCCPAGKYPTFGDYSRTLQAVITATGDKAAPESFSYRMVSTKQRDRAECVCSHCAGLQLWATAHRWCRNRQPEIISCICCTLCTVNANRCSRRCTVCCRRGRLTSPDTGYLRLRSRTCTGVTWRNKQKSFFFHFFIFFHFFFKNRARLSSCCHAQSLTCTLLA